MRNEMDSNCLELSFSAVNVLFTCAGGSLIGAMLGTSLNASGGAFICAILGAFSFSIAPWDAIRAVAQIAFAALLIAFAVSLCGVFPWQKLMPIALYGFIPFTLLVAAMLLGALVDNREAAALVVEFYKGRPGEGKCRPKRSEIAQANQYLRVFGSEKAQALILMLAKPSNRSPFNELNVTSFGEVEKHIQQVSKEYDRQQREAWQRRQEEQVQRSLEELDLRRHEAEEAGSDGGYLWEKYMEPH